MSKKTVIMVPYADISTMQSGVNVDQNKRFDIYMKNLCVALLSARYYNTDSDIMLVTNITIPENYRNILEKNNILMINAKFDAFRFSDDYKWGLAFYKLCALKYVTEHYQYDFYSYLDADIYVQSSFNNIWKECRQNILMYDINHGLQVKDYREFCNDVSEYTKSENMIVQYGGEFFAASYENSVMFISECYNIFNKMLERNFCTRFGDEFIISLAADMHKEKIKNAGAYIYRFWTGSFRLVSTQYKYNPITVIHVPDEKSRGMVKIYNYFIKNNKLPPSDKIYNILHLNHKGLKVIIKELIKKFVK